MLTAPFRRARVAGTGALLIIRRHASALFQDVLITTCSGAEQARAARVHA